MSNYRTVLELVAAGNSLETVRSTLDIREDGLQAMVQSMLREGHLTRYGCEGGTCSACPMSGSCPMGDIEAPTSYLLTERGKQYVERGRQASD